MRRPRFNVGVLRTSPGMTAAEKDSVGERLAAFQSSVSSGLRTPPTEELSVQDHWNVVRDSLVDTSCQHLGYVRRRQRDWFSESQGVLGPLLHEQRKCYGQWAASGEQSDHVRWKVARSRARAEDQRAKNRSLTAVAQ